MQALVLCRRTLDRVLCGERVGLAIFWSRRVDPVDRHFACIVSPAASDASPRRDPPAAARPSRREELCFVRLVVRTLPSARVCCYSPPAPTAPRSNLPRLLSPASKPVHPAPVHGGTSSC